MGNSPGWTFNYVPTAAEWNLWWSKKMDDPGLSAAMTSALVAGPNAASGVPTLNSSGYLMAADFPALTGDVTTAAGTVATTVGKVSGQSVSLAGSFTISGAYAVALTATAATTLQLPTNGVLTSGYWSVLTSTNALSNVNTVQAVFPTGQQTIALAASTTYCFEALYQVTRSAGTTSHTVATLFAATQTLGSINYVVRIANPTGDVLSALSDIFGTSTSAVTITAANTSATENLHIHITGIIVTGANAPSITPQLQWSAAPGGAPTVAVGSFIRVIPLGSATMTTLGSGWS